MRKPDKNSKRQRLIALPVGETNEFSRDTEKVGSIATLLFTLKQDERQAYAYKTTDNEIIVTRIS